MNVYDSYAVSDVFSPVAWERPSVCGPNGGNCVEVNLGTEGIVGMRDAKLEAGPILIFDNAEWRAFMESARAGQYDR